MKLSYPPLIVLGCIAVQILLNMLVPLEVNLSLLLGLIVLILSLGIITYAFRELSNNETTYIPCLLYTSDAADDLLCVDLGGRRIIKKIVT